MGFTKALVTGGAGFIGSHIVDRLLDRGVEVLVLDDLSTGKMEHLHPRAVFVQGDVCDLNLVRKLVAEVDVVFHEAARVSIRQSVTEFHEDAKVNLLGTLNVLEGISRSKRVKKLVYASSMAVYSEGGAAPLRENHSTDPVSPYGISKLASEKYCLQIGARFGVDTVILRYFNTFGWRQTLTPYVGVITIFINRVLAHQPPVIFGNGEQTRDFVFVGDVATANILAMESDLRNGIFNIGSGKGTSVNKIAQLISTRLHSELAPVYAPLQPGEPKDSIADIALSAQKLGYKPTVDLEEKIDDIINWWKNQPPGKRP